MKTCSTCDIRQPITNFTFRNKAKGTRRHTCNNCRSVIAKKSYYDNHETNKASAKARRKKSRYKDHNKSLEKERAYRDTEEHKAKRRAKKIMKLYGLTLQDVDDLCVLQENICPICDKELNGRLNIDHEHIPFYNKLPPEQKKKYVRGIIHWRCNLYLVCKNNLISAKKVLIYLENYENRQNEKM